MDGYRLNLSDVEKIFNDFVDVNPTDVEKIFNDFVDNGSDYKIECNKPSTQEIIDVTPVDTDNHSKSIGMAESISLAEEKLIHFKSDAELVKMFGYSSKDDVYANLESISRLAYLCNKSGNYSKFPIKTDKLRKRLKDFYIRMITIGRYSN